MPPDSTATRKSLLDAAFCEFAQHGLSGARIDRIGAEAGANKRLLYVYFGNKDELFDVVVQHSVKAVAQAVPFDADDLPAYAGALFDYLLEHSGHLRLAAWAQFERPQPSLSEVDAYRAKIDAIVEAQARGVVTPDIDAVDLLALLLGLVTSWAGASPALRQAGTSDPFDPQVVVRHRRALLTAVLALCTPR